VTSLVTTQYVTEAEECNLVALISGGHLIAFGTPAELRREALGGEVVEVTMEEIYDASALARSPGVLGVRQTGPKSFELIVDNAATATPDAIQAMAQAGAKVTSVRESRPTFEHVFTELVKRDAVNGDARREAAADGDAAA
jgi:ABC-2 type transport system ATP-binding protein